MKEVGRKGLKEGGKGKVEMGQEEDSMPLIFPKELCGDKNVRLDISSSH